MSKILLFALWFSGESCILQNPVTFLTSTQITRGDHLRRFHNIIYYLACIEICSPILIRGQQALLKSLQIPTITPFTFDTPCIFAIAAH
jgi:hypothetical protein